MKSKLFIFSIIGLVLFYFFFVFSNIEEVIKSVMFMKLEYIPLVLIFIIMSVFVKGIRQYYLLKFINITIPFKKNLIIFISGLSLIFTPAGIGGIIKSKFLKDNFNIPIKKSIPVITMEIFHEFLGLVILIAVTMVFYNFIESTIAFIFGVTISLIIYLNLRYQRILHIFRRYFMKIKMLREFIEDGVEAKKSYCILTSMKKMVIVSLLTIFSMVLELISIYIIFISLDVNQFDFIKISEITLTSLLLGQISFLPNGIGVTDGSFIGILVSRKLDLSLAISVVLMVRFIGLWLKTLLGFIAIKLLQSKREGHL